jgi:hypothetical protein
MINNVKNVFRIIIKKWALMSYLTKRKFIFYKVLTVQGNIVCIQCINSSAIFNISIFDLVVDNTIMNHLYPTHACYIGLLYANNKIIGNHAISLPSLSEQFNKYGKYSLYAKARNGNILFVNKHNNEIITIGANDMMKSSLIMREFSAKQAFYLGLLVGTDNNLCV